jgi:beta-glucosidase-like glycosyl hydrolase
VGDHTNSSIEYPVLEGECLLEVTTATAKLTGTQVSDGPNGARGGQFIDGTTAACFPSCVSIAATFNPDLARRVGVALGEECETKGAYVLLGPTVCCHRSPLGGRNFEAFSEDPLVSGSLASAYIIGLQSQRIGATVKHYLGVLCPSCGGTILTQIQETSRILVASR